MVLLLDPDTAARLREVGVADGDDGPVLVPAMRTRAAFLSWRCVPCPAACNRSSTPPRPWPIGSRPTPPIPTISVLRARKQGSSVRHPIFLSPRLGFVVTDAEISIDEQAHHMRYGDVLTQGWSKLPIVCSGE